MNRPQEFSRYRHDIEEKLKSILSRYRLPLYDMIRYHMGWVDESGTPFSGNPGKMLRPGLCLFACEALCGDCVKALPAGAALELIHNYSLIHDDIQDNDEERRHRPTVWKIWGRAQAINAGTATKVIAGLTINEYKSLGFDPQKILDMHMLLEETVLTLLDGQFLDISFEGRSDITMDEYLSMIQKKTGALIAASLKAGAMAGSDRPDTWEQFYRIGMTMGTAFQIRDDILGIWGSAEIVGKPTGSDIMKKKKSLPIVHLFSNASTEEREFISAIYDKRELKNPEITVVIGLLDKKGSRRYAENLVSQYSAECLDMILGLPVREEYKQELAGITNYLSKRVS